MPATDTRTASDDGGQTAKSALHAYEPIRPLEVISYSLGDAGFNLYWAPLTAFLMIYLTDVAGMKPAVTGTLLLTMRLAGAVVDPLFAAIADRTHTSYGQYRPWFLWLCLPLAAAGIATFSAASLPLPIRLTAIFVCLPLLNIIYSAASLAYAALSGVITPDSEQRDSLLSVRFGSAFLGAVAITWLTPKLIHWAGRGDQALGWEFTMTLYGVLSVFLFLAVFLNTQERFSVAAQPRLNPLRDVADLFCSRPWLVLFVLGIIHMAALMLHTAATPYFIKYVAARPDLVGSFMMVFYLGLAAGSGLCSSLTHYASRQVWIIVALIVAALSSLSLYLCPGTALTVLFSLQTLAGVAFGVIATLTFAMYADAADYNAWKTGYRATAMTYAMINVGKKIAAAGAGAAVGWLLSSSGYVAGAAPETAMQQMRLLLGLLPASLCLLGALVIIIYNLSPQKVLSLQTQLLGRATLKPE